MTEPGTLIPVFKALAHESRLRLLGLLAQEARTVQDLAAEVGLTEPTTSHHLAILREAGLVRLTPKGTQHWYDFDAAALRAKAKSILSREGVAALAPSADAPTDKIVRNYIGKDGRLKAFPSARGKRWHILAWFAAMFEEGRDYKEKEVNETIARYWHDFETYRREMVGYGMFTREKGIYRRLPKTSWERVAG
jgi:hypothetical protein